MKKLSQDEIAAARAEDPYFSLPAWQRPDWRSTLDRSRNPIRIKGPLERTGLLRYRYADGETVCVDAQTYNFDAELTASTARAYVQELSLKIISLNKHPPSDWPEEVVARQVARIQRNIDIMNSRLPEIADGKLHDRACYAGLESMDLSADDLKVIREFNTPRRERPRC